MCRESSSWKLINSPIFIWLLSTVMIGGITWAYSKYSAYLENEKNRVEKILKLDLEIKNRLRVFGGIAEKFEKKPDEFSKFIVTVSNPKKAEYPIHVFPEYRERTLTSLLWELESLVDEKEKEEIHPALSASQKLQDIYQISKIPSDIIAPDIESEFDIRKYIALLLNRAPSLVSIGSKKTLIESYISPLNLKRWDNPFQKYLIQIKNVENCQLKEARKKDNQNHTIENIFDVIIDKTKCTGCGECVDVCPTDVFELKNEKAEVVRKKYCIGCESCLEMCPNNAIKVKMTDKR